MSAAQSVIPLIRLEDNFNQFLSADYDQKHSQQDHFGMHLISLFCWFVLKPPQVLNPLSGRAEGHPG
jgi:hypothetical protein